LGQSEKQITQIEEINSRIADQQRKVAFISTLNSSISAFFSNIGPWIVLILAIQMVERQELNGVMLAAIVLSSLASFEMINQLSISAEYLQKSIKSAERIFEVLDHEVQNDFSSEVELSDGINSIKFESMTFAYSDEEHFGLKDISFELGNRKKIALVGSSGAGKTTIINLLLGFWKLNNGSYTINDINVDLIKKDRLNRIFSVCEQDAYIFAGSLKSNFDFDADDISREDVEKIIEYVRLKDLVSRLPEGLDTWVGEHGKTFSAGELQRILIGRTLLRKSDVLIFDEPTSNLDAIHEREIIRMITELKDDRSLLLITHRLVGMDAMDEILLIDKGELIERGTHQDLISLNGEYSKMWEIQQQLIRSN
jgi:ATP-binding cassette subfamily C protein CydC